MASQSVVDQLIDEQAEHIQALAQSLETAVSCQVEPGYTQEEYDIIVSLAEARQAKKEP